MIIFFFFFIISPQLFSLFFLSDLFVSRSQFFTDTLVLSCFSFIVYFLRRLKKSLSQFFCWTSSFSCHIFLFYKLFLLVCPLFIASYFMDAIFSLFPLQILKVVFWIFSNSAPYVVSLTSKVLSFLPSLLI